MPSITLDRKIIHYDEAGKRSRDGRAPIVLLHGFPLDNGVFESQLTALSHTFRVITPDLPGFGQSKSDLPFTIASLADDVHALLRYLGALPCALGGLSMGGYVAQAFAKKYPNDLEALTLIDTKAEADNAEGKEKRNKMIELVRTGGSKAVADAMFPNMITPEHASVPEIGGKLRAIMESCPAKTTHHALAAMRDREDYTSMLPSIAVPTLLIVGERDVISPKQTMETMHRAIPRSTLIVIAGAGHLTPMEKPEEVSAAIRGFLEVGPT
jgi:pimeloyl-ACP methyl ester carboxylesterase